MSRYALSILGLSWLAAGCASTANPDSAASSTAALTDPAITAANVPVKVVTAEELPVADEEELNERRVICREMLQQASNQLVRRCMTRASWRTYDRAQEEWAKRMLRQFQGSPYR